jgi:hypothetical protein
MEEERKRWEHGGGWIWCRAQQVAGVGFPAVERETREREKRNRWRKMK